MKTLREEDKILDKIKHIHMVGIGGSGMYPLAEILNAKGYTVSGSDKNVTELTRRLETLGIKVYCGQSKENVTGAQLVVYSAAVPENNPERIAAKELNIPTMERSHLLGALTRKYDNVIGVCGTHGKTTVTSMITQILLLNKMQPTAVIGGKLPIADSFCVVGNSQNFVCESCEFVDSFLQFSPDISVLLNIDNDHLDYFGTMENLEKSFLKFISMSKICYANGDDSRVRHVLSQTGIKKVTYGFESTNDYYAANITAGKRGYCFDVVKQGKTLGKLCMSVPGRHNILNGLVSFAVCFEMGVNPCDIANSLEKFSGAGRRFEFIGEVNGITVADDYAHHPTEIAATLNAAKSLDYKRVIVVFQPYTYSRVNNLKDGMIESLSIADKVFLTPIVASRETNIYNVSSFDIAKGIDGAEVIEDYDILAQRMLNAAQSGDIIITMGAGDIYKVARKIVEKNK
ncbi:MAG: UDP-N-acetylmuramate--L-alanine ligase [Clostridia bacterium]|nr:UDP-N-acetylmuramate--L-alanine ligase [Clostridia bacterium]